MKPHNTLEHFTAPRSIAIIGASEDPTRIGGRPLRYLIEASYPGAIFPINPKHQFVQGLRAYSSVSEVPTKIDCALIILPALSVVDAVVQCAAVGVKAIIIFSAGFAETGPEGAQMQDEIMAIARHANMRVLGPNCLGLFCKSSQAYLTFSGVFDDVVGTNGDLGLVSQSGGFAGEIVKLSIQRGLQFGTWLTTGNEADVELGEALIHLAQDPNLRVICIYMEGARKRESFLAGLALARRNGKRVVALKAGRSEVGAAAVQSHTAGMAGSDRLYNTLFDQYNAYRSSSIEEMLDVVYAARQPVRMQGKRLAILSTSGGNGALAADYAADLGFSLEPLAENLQQRIRALSPHAATANPIDLTAKAASDPSIIAKALEALISSGSYDGFYVFVGLIAGIPALIEPLLNALSPIPGRYPGVPIALSITAPDAVVRRYEAAGFLLIQDPRRAITALHSLTVFDNCPVGLDPVAAMHRPSQKTGDLIAGRRYNEVESKALLQQIGIPLLKERIADNPKSAEQIATALGGRVALKIVSPDILHKTDVGGVRLHVSCSDVLTSISEMMQAVKHAKPEAQIDGVLISPMLDDALEFIVGVHVDAVFGPVIMVGAGGIAVEITDDVACQLAPVDTQNALAMVRSLKCGRLLDGFRNRPRADINALVNTIVTLSEFAYANAQLLGSIEINPLAVLPEGEGVVALDALIETAPALQALTDGSK
ncbi:acetate--CoA ligase family protein [Parapusillimonas granuli]|uniref:Acetate--CoA ligase family protein n=1 Tax=Parapusillimonas granuli TaxID=380911 RepID=A0A853FVR5_9BURK|nr:acetate--CoA ligase family protein [Parapusillimonas granuli]MBB5214694.1 acyl-CoA synthetase (NDP forming) [Parapusillimonas granuli]MEB2398058.1 acetate--CoA ligase family protein [Alcaligenaceae bacterium]NYT48898.1 acetate--CoA ligase family protein [Parapusillimonas granuli]